MFKPTAQLSDWLMFEYESPFSLQAYLAMTQSFSPYQLNPLNYNPLRELLVKTVDFDGLQKSADIKLFIGATQVRTGKLHIFNNAQLSVDALLASACLPSIHHAVTINGEAYWDGGYTGNPPVYPLIFNCQGSDVLIVVVQPLQREKLPVTAEEIRMRAAELSFNTAFLREMRAIAFSKEYIDKDWLPLGKLERMLNRLNIHMVENANVVSDTDASSRYGSPPEFIQLLHDEGYDCCSQWLKNNCANIGKQSTVNLQEVFN
ncbi:MAG: patatin-like phospholipase family protein [Gammaproteobacteria bacterium]